MTLTLANDPYTKTESGILVPTPSGVEVTWVHTRYGNIFKVHEEYQEVVDAWLNRPTDNALITFHDWCYTDKPVTILGSEIVAFTIGWEDTKVVEQDLKERELAMKLRDKNLAQMAFEAGRKIK